jgi:hypothetical protein
VTLQIVPEKNEVKQSDLTFEDVMKAIDAMAFVLAELNVTIEKLHQMQREQENDHE